MSTPSIYNLTISHLFSSTPKVINFYPPSTDTPFHSWVCVQQTSQLAVPSYTLHSWFTRWSSSSLGGFYEGVLLRWAPSPPAIKSLWSTLQGPLLCLVCFDGSREKKNVSESTGGRHRQRCCQGGICLPLWKARPFARSIVTWRRRRVFRGLPRCCCSLTTPRALSQWRDVTTTYYYSQSTLFTGVVLECNTSWKSVHLFAQKTLHLLWPRKINGNSMAISMLI